MSGFEDSPKRIVIMWTKFLPYHVARIRHLRDRLHEIGWTLTAIEVASKDALYPFPDNVSKSGEDYICLFSGKSYRALSPYIIHKKAFSALESLQPDAVIAPATPFPSGMAAVKYGLEKNKLCVMMDDAWELSDMRGFIVSMSKKIIHRNIDAVFIPAPSHASYYVKMGFPMERIFYGVDVVDNDFFSNGAKIARGQADSLRASLGLPLKYFIFVGRFIGRKGIPTLLEAYRRYSSEARKNAWGLVLVGDGDELQKHQEEMRGFKDVKFVGSQFAEKLCNYYGLASAFILPSVVETWGLVVNEAMASGLTVIISKGCGAGRALVEEGQNGWTFDPGDTSMLSQFMFELTAMSSERLHSMGLRSKEIIAQWSLDTFADSIISAVRVPQREPGGIMANLLTKFWNGRISFYP